MEASAFDLCFISCTFETEALSLSLSSFGSKLCNMSFFSRGDKVSEAKTKACSVSYFSNERRRKKKVWRRMRAYKKAALFLRAERRPFGIQDFRRTKMILDRMLSESESMQQQISRWALRPTVVARSEQKWKCMNDVHSFHKTLPSMRRL